MDLDLYFENIDFFSVRFNYDYTKKSIISIKEKHDFNMLLNILSLFDNIKYSIKEKKYDFESYKIILENCNIISYSDNHNSSNLNCSLNSDISSILIKGVEHGF